VVVEGDQHFTLQAYPEDQGCLALEECMLKKTPEDSSGYK
jgi:hypothetical protein